MILIPILCIAIFFFFLRFRNCFFKCQKRCNYLIWVYAEVEGNYHFYCCSLSNDLSVPYPSKTKQTATGRSHPKRKSRKQQRVHVDMTCAIFFFLTNGTRKWGEKSKAWTFHTLTITTIEFYNVKLPSGVNYTATMRSVSKVIPSLTMQAAAPGWRQLLPSLKLPSRSHVGHLQAYSYTPVDLEYCSIWNNTKFPVGI